MKWFVYFFVLTLPLAIPLALPGGMMISLPSEVLMISLAGIMLIRWYNGKFPDSHFLTHPVTLLILFDLGITFLATLTSEIPVVSWKRFLVKALFVIAFYFYFGRMAKDIRLVYKILFLFVSGLVLTVIMISIRHGFYGWEWRFSPAIPKPFFYDHTYYGGVLAFSICLLPAFWMRFREDQWGKLWVLGSALILLTGLILSSSRAAWLSLVIAGICFVLIRLKINYRVLSALWLAIWLAFAGLLGAASKGMIHSENVSNQERINRWLCSWRLFEERPVLGWGPGTYQYVYGPFQKVEEMTRISTYQGNMGNAHSEYLGPLAETGVPGFLSFLAIILVTTVSGLKRIYHTPDPNLSWLLISVLTALISCWIHGLVNNFFEQDKMAFLVLVAMSVIVSKQGSPGERPYP